MKRKGVVDIIVWWILALIVIIVVFRIIFLLTGRGQELINHIKNFFIFGK